MKLLNDILKLAKPTLEALEKAQKGEIVNVLFECSNGDVLATFTPKTLARNMETLQKSLFL